MIPDRVETFSCPPEIEALNAVECFVDSGPGPGGTDPQCDDPAFAAAHPELCGNGNPTSKLVIKPELASICLLQPLQFKTFLVNGTTEQEVTSEEYLTSNFNTVLIGVVSGQATGVGAGIVTISTKWQGLSASAQIQVIAECCEAVHVAALLVIDNSKSMSQQFSPAYSTKLTYAKLLARRFAQEINTTKDQVGLMSFNEASTLVEPLTTDLAEMDMQIAQIGQTASDTDIFDGLGDAIAYLNQQTGFERKLLVFITDGDARPEDQPDPRILAEQFKSTGAVLMVVGIRSHDGGFELLNSMATGGFFVNATEETEAEAFDWVSGLKGYVCGGNCKPPGGECVPYSALDFDEFEKWDVSNGTVDLIGGSPPYQQFDFLPGNGLYVDLAGTTFPSRGTITTKEMLSVVAGNQYELSYFLAGNQREPRHHVVRVRIETIPTPLVDVTIPMPDYKQGFTLFTNTFTPTANSSVRISFVQVDAIGNPTMGVLLDVVRLKNLTTGETLFFDDFDGDNVVCLPNECNPPSGGGGGAPVNDQSHDIINIDYMGGEEGETTKTGAAAIGIAGDFWVTYGGSIIDPVQFGAGANLVWADGRDVETQAGPTLVQASLSEPNYPWQASRVSTSPDPMMASYLETTIYTPKEDLADCQAIDAFNDPTGCRFQTINSLPTAVWTFHILGHGGREDENARFALAVDGHFYPAQQTAEGNAFLGPFAEGEQYVTFTNVMVNFGQTVYLFILPPVLNSNGNMYSVCSGLQIKQVMAPSGTGGTAVAPAYYGYTCYGASCLQDPIPAQNPDSSPLPDLEA